MKGSCRRRLCADETALRGCCNGILCDAPILGQKVGLLSLLVHKSMWNMNELFMNWKPLRSTKTEIFYRATPEVRAESKTMKPRAEHLHFNSKNFSRVVKPFVCERIFSYETLNLEKYQFKKSLSRDSKIGISVIKNESMRTIRSE